MTADLQSDSSVVLAVRVTCEAGAGWVETTAGADQGDVFGESDVDAVPCDGHWHRTQATVPAFEGEFAPGWAGASASVGVELPGGELVIASDAQQVRIR